MASLIETLETDLHSETRAREALEDRRNALEAQAENDKSYDGVRDALGKVDEDLTAQDRKLETLRADVAREQARRERARKAPAARQDGDELAEGPITPLGGFNRMPAGLATQFLGAEPWQAYQKAVAPRGFSMNSRVEGPKIDVQGSLIPWMQRKGLVTGGSATSAGAFIVSDDTGIFDPGPFQRELTVLDVITRGTTDSDTVEFVRQTASTNNAAIVPEADNVLNTDDTGRKPWSSLALERVSATVETIAHGEAATTRALSDAGQMRTIIDNFLRYGLLEELEDEIVNGPGGAGHFDGITTITGTQTQAFSTDIATTLRKAKTLCRKVGRAVPNAVILNPDDWEALDLFLTLEGGGTNNRQAADESVPRIWGMRIVESEAVTAGTAIVGDFRRAVLWDRQQTTVQATSGYMDFFMKNLVAILAELRAAFGVVRPKAFVITDVSSGS